MELDKYLYNNKSYNFKNFKKYLFYSYANLTMLHAAIKINKVKYDKQCYMIRSKALKSYNDETWHIHDLFENNVSKMKTSSHCFYCGKEFKQNSDITIEHIFARIKGGDNVADNIIMVCKHCNSSKGKMDLFEWFLKQKEMFPPIFIIQHYLKLIYKFAEENNLLKLTLEEIEVMDLPFNFKYIPMKYPQPEYFINNYSSYPDIKL